jgi:hypothetical protein
MSSLTGLVAQGNYAGAANDQAAIDVLLALLPNPDAAIPGTGATANAGKGSNHFDEMSPGAAAQLRVELLAMRAAIGTTNTL